MTDDSLIVPLDDVLCIMLGVRSYMPQRGLNGVINTIAFMTRSSPDPTSFRELWQQCDKAIKAQHVMLRHTPPPPVGASDYQVNYWLGSLEAWHGSKVLIRRISTS